MSISTFDKAALVTMAVVGAIGIKSIVNVVIAASVLGSIAGVVIAIVSVVFLAIAIYTAITKRERFQFDDGDHLARISTFFTVFGSVVTEVFDNIVGLVKNLSGDKDAIANPWVQDGKSDGRFSAWNFKKSPGN